MERDEQNRRALSAAADSDRKSRFIEEEQAHILALLRRITGRGLSMNDDEWSIALLAVSEAVDSYDESRGSFWSYASIVMRSRLTDFYRSSASGIPGELLVEPSSFSGEFDEDSDTAIGVAREVAGKTATVENTSLRDEIEALSGELERFGIDFFQLAECSPRTAKTRKSCGEILETFFWPPPLTEQLRQTGKWPVKELQARRKLSRKQMDNHRRYLIAAALILSGDYPGLRDYMPWSR